MIRSFLESITQITGPLTLAALLATVVLALYRRSVQDRKGLKYVYKLLKERLTRDQFYSIAALVINRTFLLTITALGLFLFAWGYGKHLDKPRQSLQPPQEDPSPLSDLSRGDSISAEILVSDKNMNPSATEPESPSREQLASAKLIPRQVEDEFELTLRLPKSFEGRDLVVHVNDISIEASPNSSGLIRVTLPLSLQENGRLEVLVKENAADLFHEAIDVSEKLLLIEIDFTNTDAQPTDAQSGNLKPEEVAPALHASSESEAQGDEEEAEPISPELPESYAIRSWFDISSLPQDSYAHASVYGDNRIEFSADAHRARGEGIRADDEGGASCEACRLLGKFCIRPNGHTSG